ncbi:hypothetical protein NDU88_001184 [Pleurodeles waltl]|uniref:Uncharacterized protein n=1 Tax=Pleurodeles waltl TaxID=8319 RepID=A0AAV7MJU2_PLEWA|nr:hypothetical protein NDU88_001184 [Pleurodeles waltl]
MAEWPGNLYSGGEARRSPSCPRQVSRGKRPITLSERMFGGLLAFGQVLPLLQDSNVFRCSMSRLACIERAECAQVVQYQRRSGSRRIGTAVYDSPTRVTLSEWSVPQERIEAAEGLGRGTLAELCLPRYFHSRGCALPHPGWAGALRDCAS